MNDGLFTMVTLLGAMANGPSNAGDREDGKVCTAQAGECRFNGRYYSLGMRDAKSWSMPAADETCPDRCPYLSEQYRDLGTEEERRNRMGDMIGALAEKRRSDTLTAALLLGSLEGVGGVA
jgi:hypothetical protein